MTEVQYYSISLDIGTEEELDRVVKLARSMPFYRIYIDDKPDEYWVDDYHYSVEVLFVNEHDVTMFQLKL